MSTSSARVAWPLWRAPGLSARVAFGYLLLYLALEWVSFIHPMRGLNITPWNPQAALAVSLLLWRPAAWWVVWSSAACAQAFVEPGPFSWGAVLLESSALAAGAAATAAALAHWLGRRPLLGTRRDFIAFLLVIAAGALVTSLLHVGALAALGVPQPDRLLAAVHRAWVGDAVGLVVTLPLLLVLANPERRASALAMLRSSEWWLVALVAVAATLAVFTRPGEEQFKFFYLLFVPVVWGAARFGVTGAVGSAVLVQVLLIVAVQAADYRPPTVFELQLLMAALAATGLLLGTTVDEREETARKLRASLRMAAAGDMAAALAHELNQPLMALSSYARAAQLLAGRVAQEQQALAGPLVDVSDKLVAEAARAAEVVRRLRNFFRDRRTELQPAALGSLLEETMQAELQRAGPMQVRLDWSCDPTLPPLWLDPVQVAVVLRNLVSNALDAAGQGPGEGRTVAVRAAAAGSDVLVEVLDSGPGLSTEEVAAVFEWRRSGKPGGMGIGLGISRAIVEAHGGRLWAEPGPGGRFYFTLPIAAPAHHE